MKRISQLDVLRAIAVFLVVGSHVSWSPPEIDPDLSTSDCFTLPPLEHLVKSP
jgi:peptidoglycan/LPS O-acetylase OafA/YrhL